MSFTVSRSIPSLSRSLSRRLAPAASSSVLSHSSSLLSTPSLSFSSPSSSSKSRQPRVQKVYSRDDYPEYYEVPTKDKLDWIEDPVVAQFDKSNPDSSPATIGGLDGGMKELRAKIDRAADEFETFMQIPNAFSHNFHTPERLELMSKKYRWVNFDRFAAYINEIDKQFFDDDIKMVGEHWTNRDGVSPRTIELEFRKRKVVLEQLIEDYKMRTLLPYRLFVDSGQTVKVTRQGKLRSSWVMMIAGDQNGTIGFGIGKAEAEEGESARDRAWNNVKRNLLFVPLVESRTVLHPYTGRHGVCEIKIRPLPRGHGMTAGPLPRMIFEACGIRDVSANIYGRALRKHQVFATFDALRNQSSIRELGIARGLNPYPLFDPGMHRYEPMTRDQMREKYNDLQLRLMQLARTMGFDHELGRFVRNPAYHKEAAQEAKENAEKDPFRDYLNRDTTPLSHGYGTIPHPNPVPTNVGRNGRKI